LSPILSRVAHRVGRDRRDEFVARGFRPGSVFPHTIRFLPKAGPDGYKLAGRMVGQVEPDELWEIVVHADPSVLTELPADVFFDDDVVWHQQQFGLPGQVATANVVLRGDTAWSMVHISDLVQRIGRRRELKTRVENRFRGWHDMLLNGLLAFAAGRGVARIRLARASLAMENTDPRRSVRPELFERVYDRDPNRLYRVDADGDWWVLDVERNRDRLVEPLRERTAVDLGRVVCLCHDLERGLGHEPGSGPPEQDWDGVLHRMLEVERTHGLRATYNVVGTLLGEVRPPIAAGGHCVAFHSFDHRLDDLGQLDACRRLDYRLKGYRPPRSVITEELGDERLLFHNFEWLSSSASSLGFGEPVMRRGLVRVPVQFDDHPVFTGRVRIEDWERSALATVAARDVTVFTLHDCYAHLWLDRYDAFLERVLPLATFLTIDELAAELTLAAAQ
jgi:peptidoglycan/xylan/chitin deacetylase (PgdA/CDA1 family)